MASSPSSSQNNHQRLSQRAYAKHRGVDEASVRKAIKTGRITLEPDGTIDPLKADLEWERNTRPRKHSNSPSSNPSASSVPPSSTTFLQARTAHEVLKVQTGKVRLQSLKGDLIDRRSALNHVFQLGRALRDSWLNWPTRVASVIAEELSVNAHTLQMTLDHYVREHLTQQGEIKPQFEEGSHE